MTASTDTPNDNATDLNKLMPDEDALRKQIEAAVDAQITGQITPLQGQVTQLGTTKDNAVTRLDSVYGDATTAAQDSTDATKQSYDQALQAEKSIMQAATERMAQFRQNTAAGAQKLAQLIGVSVPIDSMFTAPTDLESSLFAADSAGSLLKASGLAQAGVQHAEAFSGRVLPLLHAQEIADTTQAFDNKIAEIQSEIAAIKGQKNSMVDQQLNDRLLQEKQLALQTVQANRDWYTAKSSAQLEAKRLALQAADTYGKGVVWDPKTKTYKAGPTGSPKTVSGKQVDQAAQQLKMQKQQTHAAYNATVAQNRANYFDLADKMLTPGVKSVEVTQWPQVHEGDPGAVWTGSYWAKPTNVKVATTASGVKDPNDLYAALQGAGANKKLAQEITALKFKGWEPGKDYTAPGSVPLGAKVYSQTELWNMSPVQVIKVARNLGFKQKVPPGIAILNKKKVPDYAKIKEAGGGTTLVKGGATSGKFMKDNPKYDPKAYNDKLKHFYIYWIQRAYLRRNDPAALKKLQGR